MKPAKMGFSISFSIRFSFRLDKGSYFPESTSGLLKCPKEQFLGIVYTVRGTILHPKDRPSKDFPYGIYRICLLGCKVRPGSHPPYKCPAPFGPGPEETGPGAFELGAIYDEALDFWGFERHEPLGDGGQEPAIL